MPTTKSPTLPIANEFQQMAVYYGYIVNRFARITVSFDGTYGRFEICLYHTKEELEKGEQYYTRTYRGINRVPDKYHPTCVKMYAMVRKCKQGQCTRITQKALDEYN